MKNLLSKLCLSLSPYTAGEQPQDKKYVKLNTNENPYPPCDEVNTVLKNFDYDNLKLYPDYNNTKLVNLICEKYSLKSENVFVGNGSDEVLAMCFPSFFTGKKIAFANVTYSFYESYAKLFNTKVVLVNLKNNFELDVNDYIKLSVGGVIIANPNAPTSLLVPIEQIEKLVSSMPNTVVIVDEAYADFSKTTATELVKKYNNVLVVKTFSKSYSLANIRCGYALGAKTLIAGLKNTKNSFNSYTVNSITESCASVALAATEYYDACTNKVIETRNTTSEALASLGFKVLNSNANFLFCEHNKISGENLYLGLKEKGVLIRHFKKPLINNFIRVTIGTDAQMQVFLSAVKTLLNK